MSRVRRALFRCGPPGRWLLTRLTGFDYRTRTDAWWFRDDWMPNKETP